MMLEGIEEKSTQDTSLLLCMEELIPQASQSTLVGNVAFGVKVPVPFSHFLTKIVRIRHMNAIYDKKTNRF